MAKTIDIEAFEAAFMEAIPGAAAKSKEQAGKAANLMNAGDVQTLGAFDALDGVCDIWEKAEPFVGTALRILGFFSPTAAAALKALVAAFKKTIIPVICPVA